MSSKAVRFLWVTMVAAGCSSAPPVEEPTVPTAGTHRNTGYGSGQATSRPKESPSASGKEAQPIGPYSALALAIRSSKTQQVQEEAAKILASNQNDIVALNALAMWNFRQGKTGAAKLLLAKAIEKAEPNAAILNNYGLTLLTEGDELGSAEQFKRALRLDERHAEANANLGAHYAKGGDWKRARPRLEAAWNGGRTESSVANNYALALKADGEFEKARRIFDEAVKRNNKDPVLLLNFAGLLIENLNRPKEGLPLVYRVKFLETEKKDVLMRANQLERKASGTGNP